MSGGSKKEVNTRTVSTVLLHETDLDAVIPHGDSPLKSALKQSEGEAGAAVPKQTETKLPRQWAGHDATTQAQ